MTDQSRLAEKTGRVSDTRETKWQEVITAYLREIPTLSSESARSHRFAMLMQELLGLEPGFIESFTTGIEKYLKVKQKDRILKGKADNLYGNVVMEFEANLKKKRAEAEDQLRRYVAILWSQEQPGIRTPYLCLATDGVRFVTFSPIFTQAEKTEFSPDDIKLRVIEEADWTQLQPQEIYYWLDRYFLRKEILHPTSETIVRDFGYKSHAFQSSMLTLQALWQEIKLQSEYAVVFNSWNKYLGIISGTQVASDELFIRHTYIATLAKTMCWIRITESSILPDDREIAEMLEGLVFKRRGIENFIEEDFFSWLARSGAMKTGKNLVRWLFSLLQNYNLRELSEDVLKSLYQELVDPETRHDLGEVYTPDWLAHRIVNKLLDENPHGALLDPTCGSGTFLYVAIREKRRRLVDSPETLQHILQSVYGVDIHPLAVIIARTNYVLALGDLIKKRHSSITIPIYLADTIKLPEREVTPTLWMQLPSYRIELDGNEIHLPEILLENSTMYDRAIELTREYAQFFKGKEFTLEMFQNFLTVRNFLNDNNKAVSQALFALANVLKQLIETERDTIWAFILKNIYKPLFLKRKFDFIVGNPPWLTYRFVQQPEYQAFLKKQITDNYRLLTAHGELITHLELATLFFIRVADLYLKHGGTIVFVLPRSIFNADQHDRLRKRAFKLSEDSTQNLFWKQIWDCENVSPIFKIPTCVLLAYKGNIIDNDRSSISGEILSGKLERKNASLVEAEKAVVVNDIEFLLHTKGKRSFWSIKTGEQSQAISYYKSMFYQGATIVPRSFWFVQIQPQASGFSSNLPPLETAERARQEAKAAYRTVYLKDLVESHFLYTTLLSTDLLPFGHLDFRLVVLPIEPDESNYRIVDIAEAISRGLLNLVRWLENVEKEWSKRRNAKAERMTAIEWLDYRNKLTNQNPISKYRVIYNTSGTYLTAAIIKSEPVSYVVNGQRIATTGFIADTKTYFYETDNQYEALYLLAVLNSPLVNKHIKPMQSRGLWGPRDIHKKVLELPIPKFDAANPIHQHLVEIVQACTEKVADWQKGGGAGKIKSIGRLRGMVREMLKDDLAEIDRLVEKLLQ